MDGPVCPLFALHELGVTLTGLNPIRAIRAGAAQSLTPVRPSILIFYQGGPGRSPCARTACSLSHVARDGTFDAPVDGTDAAKYASVAVTECAHISSPRSARNPEPCELHWPHKALKYLCFVLVLPQQTEYSRMCHVDVVDHPAPVVSPRVADVRIRNHFQCSQFD